MTAMELQALSVIWDFGGEATLHTIAKELKVSLEYVRLICEALGAGEYLNMTRGGLCTLKGKGKLAAAKKKATTPKKIVVASPMTEDRSSKKRRLIVGY